MLRTGILPISGLELRLSLKHEKNVLQFFMARWFRKSFGNDAIEKVSCLPQV